jgi:hypothetical protein
MKQSSLFLKAILLAGLILADYPVFSQSKFELSGGLGIPELINGRIKYGGNLQIGVCAGFATGDWYGDNYVDWSVAAEVTYHFSGKSKYVDQSPWYVLGGLGYYHLPIVDPYEQYDIGFYPRAGRTFNFSKKTGINLDGGLFLPLSMTPDYGSFDFKALFSGCISFFIRL